MAFEQDTYLQLTELSDGDSESAAEEGRSLVDAHTYVKLKRTINFARLRADSMETWLNESWAHPDFLDENFEKAIKCKKEYQQEGQESKVNGHGSCEKEDDEFNVSKQKQPAHQKQKSNYSKLARPIKALEDKW